MTIETRLAEIRTRVEAASNEPWFAEDRNLDEPWGTTVVYNVFHNGDTPDRDLVAEAAYDNAEFIAASRIDLPAFLAAVEAVRELHKPYPVYEFDHTNGVWAVDRDGEKKQIATLCLECTSLDEMADLEDYCWEADQNTTYYPCQTITAITAALEVQG